MKPIWRLLALGATVIFLLQACVTVRSCRHHHPYRHRHCFVIGQQITDTTSFNFTSAEYVAVPEPAVYGNKG